MRLRTVVLLASLVGIACADTESNDDGDGGEETGDGDLPLGELEPTTEDLQLLFDANCIDGCHTEGGTAAVLMLRFGEGWRERMVNVPSEQRVGSTLVIPGDPDESYVVWKLEGDPRIGGGRMPALTDPLPEAYIQVLRDWIAAGAPE